MSLKAAPCVRFVTDELRAFLTCGIPQHGFAQLYCDACKARHIVAFCCKGRGFCPSCGGRRMNEGAANLSDHVLPDEVPLRQFVLTLPFPLRFPLAFDARLLGAVLRSPSFNALPVTCASIRIFILCFSTAFRCAMTLIKMHRLCFMQHHRPHKKMSKRLCNRKPVASCASCKSAT